MSRLQSQTVPLSLLAVLSGTFLLTKVDASTAPLDVLCRTISPEYRLLEDRIQLLDRELDALPIPPVAQQSQRLGYQFWRVPNQKNDSPIWAQIDLGTPRETDAIVLVPVDAPYKNEPGAGYGFPARFRVEIQSENGAPMETLLDSSDSDFPNPGNLPVWIPTKGRSVRSIRITMTAPWRHKEVEVFALGEIMAIRGNTNLTSGLPGSAVTVSHTFESLKVWGKANLIDGQSILGAPVTPEPSRTLGFHAAMAEQSDTTQWVQVDLGESTTLDEVRLIGSKVAYFPGREGFGFPLRFRIELSDTENISVPILVADETQEDFSNPASNPVTYLCQGKAGRYVRITATKLWERAENFAFTLAELQVYKNGRNIALGKPVTCLEAFPSKGTWLAKNLTDGFSSEYRLSEWPDWLEGLSSRREKLQIRKDRQGQLASVGAKLRNQLALAGSLAGIGLTSVIALSVYRLRRKHRVELHQLRERIASDLHDDIGSSFGNIALLSEMALEAKAGQIQSDLREIRETALETADSMRDIIWLIQKTRMTPEEFLQKLRALSAKALGGLNWTFACPQVTRIPSLEQQRHLLLAFKEVLHNIQKHAQAHTVEITITEADRSLRLEIRDDGNGFDPNTVLEGNGLGNLRKRATSLGGKLLVSSQPGSGTTVTLTAKL